MAREGVARRAITKLEGKGHRAGTLRYGDHQKRAAPKPHRHQATNAARVSVVPCSAQIGLDIAHIGHATGWPLKAC